MLKVSSKIYDAIFDSWWLKYFASWGAKKSTGTWFSGWDFIHLEIFAWWFPRCVGKLGSWEWKCQKALEAITFPKVNQGHRPGDGPTPGTLDMTYLQLGKVILWWENRHQALGPAVQPCFFQWKNLWTRILWNDLKMFRMKSTESQRVDTNDMFHMWRLCRKIMLPKNDHNLDATPLIRSIHLTPEN